MLRQLRAGQLGLALVVTLGGRAGERCRCLDPVALTGLLANDDSPAGGVTNRSLA